MSVARYPLIHEGFARPAESPWTALASCARPPLMVVVVAPHVPSDELISVLGKTAREFTGAAGRAGMLVEGSGLWLVDSSLPDDGADADDARDMKVVAEHALELSPELDAWVLCVRNLDGAAALLAEARQWIVPVLPGNEASVAAYRTVKALASLGDARIILAGAGSLARLSETVSNFLPKTRSELLPLEENEPTNHELLRFSGDLRQVMSAILADAADDAETVTSARGDHGFAAQSVPAQAVSGQAIPARARQAQPDLTQALAAQAVAAAGVSTSGFAGLAPESRDSAEASLLAISRAALAASAERVALPPKPCTPAVTAPALTIHPEALRSAGRGTANSPSRETASETEANASSFISSIVDLIDGGVLPSVLADDAGLQRVDLPLDDETLLTVDSDGRAVLLAEARSMTELSSVSARVSWLKDNLLLLSRAGRPLKLDPTLAPVARVYVASAHAALTPLIVGSNTVIPYRKLRWGDRVGLLLQSV